MRIVYVAKHDSGGNDDEGAIAHSLRVLGHDVQCVRELVGHRAPKVPNPDLILFHKWDDVVTLQQFNCPKIFWYFDLVDFPSDPSLAGRCKTRIEWMDRILPYVDLAFLTDGDYVEVINDYYRDKAYWLMQGADIRVTGPGVADRVSCVTCRQRIPPHDILFTGISRGGGEKRISFVEEMKSTYGDRFYHVPGKAHGRDLANLIASSKIVVCPDSPVTDKYWSNRIYLMLGFQAFVLHPYCRELAINLPEVRHYADREDLHFLIERFLKDDLLRSIMAASAFGKVSLYHTYTHRCAEMISVVKERLHI